MLLHHIIHPTGLYKTLGERVGLATDRFFYTYFIFIDREKIISLYILYIHEKFRIKYVSKMNQINHLRAKYKFLFLTR